MKILLVENDPERVKLFKEKFPDYEFTWVKTASGGISKLNSENFSLLMLDCDLVGKGLQPMDNKSGYHVAEYLSENPDKAPSEGVIIHSLNARCSDASAKLLRNAGIPTKQRPYYWIKK